MALRPNLSSKGCVPAAGSMLSESPKRGVWFHFTLAHLFLLVLFVAMAVALILQATALKRHVRKLQQLERDNLQLRSDLAVERLHALGGAVDGQGRFSILSAWAGGDEGLAGLGQIGDLGICHLASLGNIKALRLSGASLSESAVRRLGELSNLEKLTVWECGVTDTGLAHLARLSRLRELYLGGNPVSDAGLSQLAHMKGLESLDLSYTECTDEGMANLGRLSNLRYLDLHGTNVSDDGLGQLSNLHALESLNIMHTNVTSRGLVHLHAMRALRQVSVQGLNIGPEERRAFRAALPRVVLD
jgi:Leucine-rich repeat (LRR) protein